MNLAAVSDHTALVALYQADPFFTGLYIESSRGTGRVLTPALTILAAERAAPGAGSHAARLRFAETVPVTAAHLGRRILARYRLDRDAPRGHRLAGGQGGRARHSALADARGVRGHGGVPARPELAA